MSLVVCCPCGNPLDVDRLEMVVSLTCPQCSREFELDVEDGPQRRRRAVLTVVEGTHWVGKKFLIPVETELALGRALGNWLCLEDHRVSNLHCKLRLTARGDAVLEDCKSMNGTWIGEQRIARSPLGGGQDFRVGPFQFRFALCDVSELIQAESQEAFDDDSRFLPTMRAVGTKPSFSATLVQYRFVLARWMMLAGAWLVALFHTAALPERMGAGWTFSRAGAMSFLFAVGMTLLSRKVTLVDRVMRYAPIGVFAMLSVTDLVLQLTAPAIGLLLISAAMSLLLVQRPRAVSALLAAVTGVAGALVILIAALMRLG
jgi:hypothetical protein